MSYNILTPYNFSDIVMCINFHFQVAYRNNKQSDSHGDFCNYVGTRHFLFYDHLWLSEQPHLLNHAVPMLPVAAMRQSSQATSSSDASVSSTFAAKSKKARDAKRKSAQMAATEQSKKIAEALVSLEKTNEQRVRILQETSAPCRKKKLLEVYTDYKNRLKFAREELLTAEAENNSDTSDVQKARMEVALCKRKNDEVFQLLLNSAI
jgi:hypothetical protein